ncbi:hypothetical protein QE417_000409 [Mucilaginibacter terrae]|uniref:Secreted protein n=1 Tax=Mucilaginibacter terrae TaxID=1955052 RepID=A0ABU3GNK4_9SPHI|nr:hypothetical protein [Mucilaginibacter terrae]
MNINYSILISACSPVVAACASVVTDLNYRLTRKSANENKLYEEKIWSYHVIISAENNMCIKGDLPDHATQEPIRFTIQYSNFPLI